MKNEVDKKKQKKFVLGFVYERRYTLAKAMKIERRYAQLTCLSQLNAYGLCPPILFIGLLCWYKLTERQQQKKEIKEWNYDCCFIFKHTLNNNYTNTTLWWGR